MRVRRPVAKGRNSPPRSLPPRTWGKLFPRRATTASSGNFPSDLFYDPFHAAAAAATANEDEGVDFDRRRGKEAEKSACTNPQYTARVSNQFLSLPHIALRNGKSEHFCHSLFGQVWPHSKTMTPTIRASAHNAAGKNHGSTPQKRPMPNLGCQKATFRMCGTWWRERGDVGWTAGGRMSNESETSGERRKRMARPPPRRRRAVQGERGRAGGSREQFTQ